MDLHKDFPIGGYDPHAEPRDEFKQFETDAWKVGIPSDESLPNEILVGAALESLAPAGLLIDFQGRTNGCAGWSCSHAAQGSYFAATGNAVNFSGMFAYTEAERIRGWLGRNDGAYLTDGRRVSLEIGHCEEKYMPFNGKYYYYKAGSKERNAALLNAAQYRVPTVIPLKGGQDAWDWIKSGHGQCHIGIDFPAEWYGQQPYVLPRVRNFNNIVGGHAITLSGWSFSYVPGQKYAEMINSWPGWGKKGRGLVHIDDMRKILDRASSTVMGYSHRKLDDSWRSYDLEKIVLGKLNLKIKLGGVAPTQAS